jgi:hypothetical protein
MLQGGDLQKGGGLCLVLGTKFVMLSKKKKKKEKRKPVALAFLHAGLAQRQHPGATGDGDPGLGKDGEG